MDRGHKPIIAARLKLIDPPLGEVKRLRRDWLDMWQNAKDFYVENFLRNFVETRRTVKGRIPYPETYQITRAVSKALGIPLSHPLTKSIAWDLKTRTRLFIYRKNFWGKDVPLEQFFTRPPKAIPLAGAEVTIKRSRKFKYVALAGWSDHDFTGKGTAYLKRRIREGYVPYRGGLPAMLVFPRRDASSAELHILLANEQQVPTYTPSRILSVDLNMNHISVLIPGLGPVFFAHSLADLPTTSSQYDYRLKKLLSLIANTAKATRSYVVIENLREADFAVRSREDAVRLSRAIKLPYVMLKKKLQSELVYSAEVDPSATSVQCPVHRVPMRQLDGRRFVCPVGGEVWHRDVAAVYNIAERGRAKLIGMECPDCSEPETHPVVLLEDQWLHTSWKEVLEEIKRRRRQLRGLRRRAPCSLST